MKENIIKYLKLGFFTLAIVMGAAFTQANFQAPPAGTVPPTGNPAVPINTGSVDQIKPAGLIVNNLNSFYEISVGSSGVECKPAISGSIRYQNAVGLQYCDGVNWKLVSTSAGAVTSPLQCGANTASKWNGTSWECVALSTTVSDYNKLPSGSVAGQCYTDVNNISKLKAPSVQTGGFMCGCVGGWTVIQVLPDPNPDTGPATMDGAGTFSCIKN